MERTLAILSAILGMISVIQWIIGYVSGNALRAKAQASYNQWYRVAELAEQIRSEPARATELAASIGGMADAIRSEIVAYSRERLDFVPAYEAPSQPRAGVATPRGLYGRRSSWDSL